MGDNLRIIDINRKSRRIYGASALNLLLSKFLDAVNASALAVMFVVVIKLGTEVLFDPVSGINWQTTFY